MSPLCCSQPVPLHRWSPRSPPRKRQRPRWARRGFCYRRGTWACEGRTTAAPGSRCPPTGIIYRLEKMMEECTIAFIYITGNERKTVPAEVRVILNDFLETFEYSRLKFHKGDQTQSLLIFLIFFSSCKFIRQQAMTLPKISMKFSWTNKSNGLNE